MRLRLAPAEPTQGRLAAYLPRAMPPSMLRFEQFPSMKGAPWGGSAWGRGWSRIPSCSRNGTNALKKAGFWVRSPRRKVQEALVASEAGRFDLLETMAFDPVEGVRLLELHLARMARSAHELGFDFDRHAARNELQAATFRIRRHSRLRLLLSRRGSMAIEIRPHRSWPEPMMKVAAVARPVRAGGFRPYHKSQ